MSAFKKLNKADVTTVRYAANKRWNLSYNTTTPNDSYVVVYQGKNERFNVTGSTTTNGLYQSSIYSSINHLFYQSYSGSLLNTSSLMFDTDTYTSASQQRPTASYFNYNINPYLIKNLPSSSNALIQTININKGIFGSKVLPYSFQISSSATQIIDDGYGNLFDVTNNGFYISKDYFDDLNYISGSYFVDNVESLTHIGNIFYAHGIVVITNQLNQYQSLLSGSSIPTASISFRNEHIIHENEVRCTIKESEYNLSYNPTLTINAKSGSLRDFATGSTFYPYTTTIGLYNDDNELLMVAKLSKPIMVSPNTDSTIIVRWDS